MRTIVSALYLSVSAVSLTLSVLPAHAQSNSSSSGGIEEIVVTSERREEALSKVPQSVSAFTNAKMDQLDIKNFSDLVAYTPGVTFDADTNNISIRGVNSSAGDATTGIYIDDTPIQIRTLGFGSANALPAVFDLERVEVLRGPQGTLFGAGSEGGTVRYITPTPSLTEFSTYAKGELSFTQDGAPSYEAGAAFGGPIINDVLGFRVSAWYRRDGGYIDRVDYLTGDTIDKNSNHGGTFSGRAALAWQVNPTLLITPSVFYEQKNIHNNDQYWVGLSDPGKGRYITATPELMGDKDRFALPSLKIDWTPGDIEIVSNTSYFNRNQTLQDYSGTLYNLSYFQSALAGGTLPDYVTDCTADAGSLCATPGSGYPLLGAASINLPGFGHYSSRNYVINKQDNFTQEVRVQSADPSARLTWVVGLFYTHQSQLSVERINDPQLPALTDYLWGEPPPAASCNVPPTGVPILDIWCEGLLPNGDDYINHTQGHERQEAIFANFTYAITDAVKVQAGARYARTHFDFTNFSDGAQNFGPLTGNSGKENETPFTPMGNVTWQINDDDMVYGTIAKGYRIGGANPPVPFVACGPDLTALGISSLPADYGSDTVMSYEVGSKDRFFGGRLQAAGSVYYLKWKNIQQDNYLPGCGFKYTSNLGDAESRGFDLQGEWLVTDALDIDFSLGYTDAHFTTNAATGPAPGAPTLAVKGDKLPGSPWTFSIGAQYNTDVWSHDAFLRVDYEFASREIGMTAARDPANSLYDGGLEGEPETNVLKLRAGATFGNLNLSVFADNLLNAHPRLALSHQDSDTILYEAQTLRPRTIGLTATYRN
jgi:outer membrane receptor protein involved in Fe transport